MIIFGVGLLLAAGVVVVFALDKPLSAEEALLLANVEAIAQNEDSSGDRYPMTSRCNVAQSADGKNPCKVDVVSCQGSGNGCTPQPCPTHRR